MKITGIDTYAVSPLGDLAITTGSTLGWLFVEVHTDEGLTGVGECSNWPSDGNEIVATTLAIVSDAVVGRDAGHIQAIWRDLFSRYSFLGNRGLITTVMSGIDIALWDLKGKALGEPVYSLLGGPLRPDIPVYVHPDMVVTGSQLDETMDRVVSGATRMLGEGFEAFKIDPFMETWPSHTSYVNGEISRRGIGEAREIVGALRDAIGDSDLLIDCHGNLNPPAAVEAVNSLSEFGLRWFEEPVPPESLDAIEYVATRTSVPICIGERHRTRWDYVPILQRRLAGYLMPDVCFTGGISELYRIASMAEAYNIPISPHNALGPIQILAGAHTSASIPNLYRLEYHHLWSEGYNGCVSQPLDVRNGRLHLSDRPGLGVELNHDFIADHPDTRVNRHLGK